MQKSKETGGVGQRPPTMFRSQKASSHKRRADRSPQNLLYGARAANKTARRTNRWKRRAACFLANELSGFSVPSYLLLIAGRKSWIELLRILFLDCLVWHRLGVR